MAWFNCEYYITKEALEEATKENNLSITNFVVGEVVTKAMFGNNNDCMEFRKGNSKYLLSWANENGEFFGTFSEEEILEKMKDKYIDYDFSVSIEKNEHDL